jgi:hypothetical protein
MLVYLWTILTQILQFNIKPLFHTLENIANAISAFAPREVPIEIIFGPNVTN